MRMSPGPVRHLHRVGGARPRGVVDIDLGGDRTIEWLVGEQLADGGWSR
jgi:hypothetical protein